MGSSPRPGQEQLDRLVASLLMEGYALYPYTPGAAKNATPTPFGIVYPPAYARRQTTTFDYLQVEGILEAPPAAEIEATALFLQPCGPRHLAVERRVELPPRRLDELAERPAEQAFAFAADPSGGASGGIAGRVELLVRPLAAGAWHVRFRVRNETELEGGGEIERAAALRRSLLSTHALLRAADGWFRSPLERGGPWEEAVAVCRNVNTWPVLATPGDDALLGAAIFLPDHPRLAPESRVDLFDNTEIEEALLLHVQTLSPGERAAIEAQDPAVRERVERALAAGQEEILSLHGRLCMADDDAVGAAGAARGERDE